MVTQILDCRRRARDSSVASNWPQNFVAGGHIFVASGHMRVARGYTCVATGHIFVAR